IQNARNFDQPQDEDELIPGEWLFVETAEDSQCGPEVYIKFEGLKACILDQVALGNTETKLTRKEVVRWLLDHGRHCGKDATVNRRRCAYTLPYSLVDSFEMFYLRNRCECMVVWERVCSYIPSNLLRLLPDCLEAYTHTLHTLSERKFFARYRG